MSVLEGEREDRSVSLSGGQVGVAGREGRSVSISGGLVIVSGMEDMAVLLGVRADQCWLKGR